MQLLCSGQRTAAVLVSVHLTDFRLDQALSVYENAISLLKYVTVLVEQRQLIAIHSRECLGIIPARPGNFQPIDC